MAAAPDNRQADQQQLARLKAGDQQAMKALFTAHHPRVYRFVLRIVQRPDVAEDVTAEVFVDMWRQAADFEGRSSVATWLLAIARNKALSALRKRREAPLDDEFAQTIAADDDTPEVTAQKANKSEILRACLRRLTVEQREVMELVYYQERSVGDVGHILGIPENTVKTRMFHARKRLAELCREAGLDRGWP